MKLINQIPGSPYTESGKLKELFALTSYEEKKLDPGLKYIYCTSHQCPECSTLVYSAELGSAEQEKEDTAFKKQEALVTNIFGSRD
jgi:hypothetical protein